MPINKSKEGKRDINMEKGHRHVRVCVRMCVCVCVCVRACDVYTPSLSTKKDDLLSVHFWAQEILHMNCFIPKCMGEKYYELYCRKSTLIKPFRFNESTLGNDWASSIYPSNQANFMILYGLPS